MCIFICVFFKNAIDCNIIEIPLNEISPHDSEIDKKDIDCESVLQPLVTSINPNKNPSHSVFEMPIGLKISDKILVNKLIIFRFIKSSEMR